MDLNLQILIQNIMISSFAAVGLLEFLKNFIKTEKTWIYSLIMIPLSLFCFYAVICLPIWVIGGILTVSATQLCYQTIVQTFKAIAISFGKKATLSDDNKNQDDP